VVTTGVRFMDGNSRPTANEWYSQMLTQYRQSGDLASALINGNFFMTTSNVVARRSVFADLGAFDDLRYAHDLEFFLRVIASGRRLTLVASDLVRYRYHATNTISESHAAVRVEVAACTAAFVRRVGRRPAALTGTVHQLRRVFDVTDGLGLTSGVAYFLAQPHVSGADPLMPSSYLDDPNIEQLRAELTP
jgi:hypothetical protein